MSSIDTVLLAWAADAIGSAIHSTQQLIGSTSSTLYRLHSSAGDFVLRIFDNEGWLAEEPDLAPHEAAVLRKIIAAGIAGPTLIAWADAGVVIQYPLVLMSCLPGQPVLEPLDMDSWLYQQAQALVQIHAVAVGDFPWQYVPWGRIRGQKVPPWAVDRAAWMQAITIADGPAPAYRACFLHRDYHPMNILWQGHTLTGVVDWVNACLGPAGVDLAHCRSNLTGLYGYTAADRFLEHYLALAGPDFVYDPYWDVIGVVADLDYPVEVYQPWLSFGLTHLTPEVLQARLEAYLISVLARI